MYFVLLRPIFCEKWKIAPPHTKRAPPQTFELAKLGRKIILNFGEDLFFFWRSPNFGRKKPLNFGFSPKNHSEFWRRPFFFFFFLFVFGDHLILGGKNLSISDFRRKISLNFGEDLFFFWRSPNFGRKKPLNFRCFRDISSQISDKPSETDSRSMKIRVNVVCTLLTLSK